VNNASQATLVLSMVCFPAVLFSGATLCRVHVMAGTGAAISTVIPVRWAFEEIGHDLGMRNLLATVENRDVVGGQCRQRAGDRVDAA